MPGDLATVRRDLPRLVTDGGIAVNRYVSTLVVTLLLPASAAAKYYFPPANVRDPSQQAKPQACDRSLPLIYLEPHDFCYDIARPLWKSTHEKFSAEQTWDWCRHGLEESARWAKDNGVTLALQNHPPACDDYPDVLRMVKEIDSPNLKVCLDVGMMKEKNDEAAVLKAARAVRSLQVLSHFGGEYDEQPDGTVKGEAFFKPFLRGMAEIDYAGYIGYELCHPLPVVDGKTVGLDFADKNARLAAKFMRGLLAEIRGQAT